MLIQSFSKVASTGYGIGELKAMIAQQDQTVGLLVSISSAYVLHCPTLLSSFLRHHKVLDIIFDVIFNQSKSDLSLYAVNSLTSLAIILGITYEAPDPMQEQRCENANVLEPVASNEMVTFVLENDTNLTFDKAALSSMSLVFDRMFNSGFREAEENTVKLTNISLAAMKCFLKSLSHCDTCEKSCSNLFQLAMVDLLQAYFLSQMYLIPDLEETYLARIKESMTHADVHSVIDWSVKNCNEHLLIYSLSYCLSCDISSCNKRNMLDRISQLGVREEIIACLKDLIYKELCYGK